MRFPVEQELLKGQRAGEVGLLHMGFQPSGRAAPAEGATKEKNFSGGYPDQAVSGARACRRAVFSSGVGFSGVIEGCLPIIWCENDSQMLEGDLLNTPE